MNIAFVCPHCKAQLRFEDLSQDHSPCPVCGADVSLRISDELRQENIVQQCVICGCNKVYVQKDFNRTLGVSIFAAGAVLFLALAAYNRLIEGTLVWAVFVAVDALLYKFLPNVIICYRCHAQYRDFSPNPQNQPFELGLAEKYDPLDKRPAVENPAAEWKGR